MGAIKDLLVAIHNGGDEAVEAAVALAGMEKQKRAYDVVQSAPGSDSITDIVTILRGLSFATNSPDAHESASLLHYCVNYAADEIERLRDERRWIPVSERLPEEYQTVLVMTDAGVSAGEIRFPDSECEMDETWWMVFKDMRDRLNSWAGFIPLSVVTHWMPLPEPPED
jgi:hypothetical protein